MSEKVDSKLNLAQRIIGAMEDVAYLQREEKVIPGAGFRPISRQAVVAKVRPILQKWGIVVIPSECLKSETTPYTSEKGKPMFLVTLVQGYRIANADNPDQQFTCSVCAHGSDASDRGASKALTMTEKQLFINLFHIEIGDGEESDFEVHAPTKEQVAKLNGEQIAELTEMGKTINVAASIIAKSMGCENLSEVPQLKYQEIKERLQKRMAQVSQQASEAKK